MGSLMGGWDSHAGDPKALTFQRNKSCTRDEIEAYRRSKGIEGEEWKDSSASPPSIQEGTCENSRKLQKSNSLSFTDTKGNLFDVDEETALHTAKDAWWKRTNWAFLNEHPVVNTEGPFHKFKSQSHVTSPN